MAWIVLTAAALILLIARVIPAATTHWGQIDSTGAQVTICTARTQPSPDSRTHTLKHLTDCALDNHHIRREAGDELLTLVTLAVVVAGGWHLIHRPRD